MFRALEATAFGLCLAGAEARQLRVNFAFQSPHLNWQAKSTRTSNPHEWTRSQLLYEYRHYSMVESRKS